MAIAIAEEKAKKVAAEADYYANVHRLRKGAQEMREAVYNEPDEPREEVYNEPDEPQDNYQPTRWLNGEQWTAADEPQDNYQPTRWLNGEQWTAAVVARRILRKLPKIPYNCSVDISINHYTKDIVSIQVKGYNPNRKGNEFTEMWLNGVESEEQQAETVAGWFKETEEMFEFKPNNDHLAEPVARALDAIWGGGDPVGELNDIVDGVVRKEADNE